MSKFAPGLPDGAVLIQPVIPVEVGDWQADANCMQVGDMAPGYRRIAHAAILVCSGCLVQNECLQSNMDPKDPKVQGGLFPFQRGRVRTLQLAGVSQDEIQELTDSLRENNFALAWRVYRTTGLPWPDNVDS